jgi:hypothetical protein
MSAADPFLEFTPGPWDVAYCGRQDGDGSHLYALEPMDRTRSIHWDEVGANALLMAAAPAMAKALLAALDIGTPDPWGPLWSDQARAALKAAGVLR